MAVSLLDVNLLLALAWPNHVHHAAAHRWFAANHELGWATCPLTQLGFARLAMQPAVVKIPLLFEDAMQAMDKITAMGTHHFWPLQGGLAEIHREVRARVTGHNQLTDAALLNLALRHEGRLATFDRRVATLLPPNSALSGAVALIPA